MKESYFHLVIKEEYCWKLSCWKWHK